MSITPPGEMEQRTARVSMAAWSDWGRWNVPSTVSSLRAQPRSISPLRTLTA